MNFRTGNIYFVLKLKQYFRMNCRILSKPNCTALQAKSMIILHNNRHIRIYLATKSLSENAAEQTAYDIGMKNRQHTEMYCRSGSLLEYTVEQVAFRNALLNRQVTGSFCKSGSISE